MSEVMTTSDKVEWLREHHIYLEIRCMLMGVSVTRIYRIYEQEEKHHADDLDTAISLAYLRGVQDVESSEEYLNAVEEFITSLGQPRFESLMRETFSEGLKQEIKGIADALEKK